VGVGPAKPTWLSGGKRIGSTAAVHCNKIAAVSEMSLRREVMLLTACWGIKI
jgi:hypothetical protein